MSGHHFHQGVLLDWTCDCCRQRKSNLDGRVSLVNGLDFCAPCARVNIRGCEEVTDMTPREIVFLRDLRVRELEVKVDKLEALLKDAVLIHARREEDPCGCESCHEVERLSGMAVRPRPVALHPTTQVVAGKKMVN